MIPYEKLLRKARDRVFDENGEKYEKIIKYLKYRMNDRNIIQRKETIVYWDYKRIEKETKVSMEYHKAKDFSDYCNPKWNETLIETQYIFQEV